LLDRATSAGAVVSVEVAGGGFTIATR